jgi:TonB family protein
MRLAVLLFCCALAFGQNTSSAPETKSQAPASPCDQKPKNNDYGLGTGIRGRQLGEVDILSDTQGVDFGPYLENMLQSVRENWYHRSPASGFTKRGELAIEFAIAKDGKVADMRLVASSRDVELDRAAWDSIKGLIPFPPLPEAFTGPYLALRFRFFYNLTPPGFKKLRISVSISAPGPLEEIPLGSTRPVTAVVTGIGTNENAVEWTLRGIGCSGATCGEITKDSYLAPTVMPDTPCVTLTAISKADPTARASVTVHIVEPASKTASKP